ncbi:MAG: YggS family pyridoxal phosphate-dependent enzyme [Akkermansiaceae bacterium]|nr:YggS family pyridoxal phosphate-dependent enzyme [Akkermansiaceae bacterium]
MENGIGQRLEEVRQRIAQACERSSRLPEDVRLVCVSKTFPAEDIQQAIDAGQLCFGESRLQEAQPKVEALQQGLDWHFIGRVQRNKVRKILPLFGTIHGIDSMKLAHYTDRIAGELGLRPKVFLQVNIGCEESKGGFDPAELPELVGKLAGLDHLEILGLMCIPPNEDDISAVRSWFVQMRQLRDSLAAPGLELAQLSMGMSGDYEIAIEEGATQVRVGSGIFGSRD